jgi:hypothetical protein
LPTFQRSTLPRSNLQRSTFNLQPSTFHLQRSTFNAPTFSRSHVQRSTFVTPQLPGVQRLKSPLEGFSPGVHLRGRCHGDRIGGRPARSVLSGAVSTARLSSYQHFNVQRSHVPTFPRSHVQRSHVPTFHLQRSTFNVPTFNLQRSHVPPSTFNVQRSHVLTFPRSTFNVRNSSAAWRSAIEIASGRLFAGRPPAWTLPRRPHRRSPGAKRPLRCGFNRTPEQLPTFQRSTLPRSHVQRSTLPRSHVQRSTFNAPTFPRSTFNLQRSTFNVQPSTFNLQRSTFNVQRSHVLTFPRSTFNVRNSSVAWRSAIEIASGRLFAGRPPAWTLPRRPHRRSPGAKRPLRCGFNRTPEQLPTFQRSTLPRSHVQRSTLPRSHVQRSTFNAPTFPRSTFNLQRSTFNVQPSTFNLQRSTFNVQRSHVLTLPRSTFNVRNSSATWRSAIEIASGRLFAGRPPAWTLPRRPHRRSPGAKRPLRRGFNRTPEQLPTFQRSTLPRSTFNVRNSSVAWRSAIEIASGRLFAGRPPAWTLPRRPHRRSPGAKRPLRRGFNRTPEQLPTFQRSTLPRSHVPTFNAPTFPRSTFNVQRSTFQPSTFNVPTFHLQRSTFQPSTFNVQRSTFNVPPSTFNVPTFNLQRSHVPTFNVQPSTFNLQRSTFNPHSRTGTPRSARYCLTSRIV